jgi:hypothetical protein
MRKHTGISSIGSLGLCSHCHVLQRVPVVVSRAKSWSFGSSTKFSRRGFDCDESQVDSMSNKDKIGNARFIFWSSLSGGVVLVYLAVKVSQTNGSEPFQVERPVFPFLFLLPLAS